MEPHLLECEIQNAGSVYENTQVRFSDRDGESGAVTDVKDQKLPMDVAFCLENDIDYIILSVYHGKEEILDLKQIILD